jgi:hypothetical protein
MVEKGGSRRAGGRGYVRAGMTGAACMHVFGPKNFKTTGPPLVQYTSLRLVGRVQPTPLTPASAASLLPSRAMTPAWVTPARSCSPACLAGAPIAMPTPMPSPCPCPRPRRLSAASSRVFHLSHSIALAPPPHVRNYSAPSIGRPDCDTRLSDRHHHRSGEHLREPGLPASCSLLTFFNPPHPSFQPFGPPSPLRLSHA